MDTNNADFVDDGSFLVLRIDGNSLSPIALTVDNETTLTNEDSAPLEMIANEISSATQQDLIFSTKSFSSVSSDGADSETVASSEEINFLLNENKKLTEVLQASNETLKRCISTIEQLKLDQEEFKRRDVISQKAIVELRNENAKLHTQVISLETQLLHEKTPMAEVQLDESFAVKHPMEMVVTSTNCRNSVMNEMTENLKTVLAYNEQLWDQLLPCQKQVDELKRALESLQTLDDSVRKAFVMSVDETETLERLEEALDEKAILVECLRNSLDDTAKELEIKNKQLKQKNKRGSAQSRKKTHAGRSLMNRILLRKS